MGLITKVLKFNGVVFIGGAAYTVHQYPELRKDPHQLMKAMLRSLRCLKAGSLMAYDYLYVSHVF